MSGNPDMDWTPEMYEVNKEECRKVLQDFRNWERIPVLNPATNHKLKDHQLIRFIGMVQDMFNPEYFLSRYEVANKENNDTSVRSGRYRDTAACLTNEYVLFNSSKNVNEERQTFYCITIPAMNKWVSHIPVTQLDAPGLSRPGKRSAECDSECAQPAGPTTPQKQNSQGENSGGQDAKRKTQEGSTSSSEQKVLSKNSLYNLPIEDENAMACLVKVRDPVEPLYCEELSLSGDFSLPGNLCWQQCSGSRREQGVLAIHCIAANTNFQTYEGDETPPLKLNDVIEVIGFLSVNPSLAYTQAEDEPMDFEEEVHNPPPSAVPRLHAVHIRKLEGSVPNLLTSEEDAIVSQAESIRKDLLLVLTQVLLGDTLAANYLICHLISSVFMRKDMLTCGQFSLNLTNVPQREGYTSQLYKIIERIVAKSHLLPFTLENMNTLALIPKKCYEGNRLTSGLLQLSNHTHLVVDETKLEPGRLDAMGVQNVGALNQLIAQQIVNYDFKFYQMPFHADIPVLVLSEGKSLLPNDVRVPLQPDSSCESVLEQIFEAAGHFLRDPLLSSIRSYIQVMRHMAYDLTEDIQKRVQDDFVEMRRVDPENTSADGLHSLLVLARLLSLSRGQKSLTVESWQEALSMESERKTRISNAQRPTVEP